MSKINPKYAILALLTGVCLLALRSAPSLAQDGDDEDAGRAVAEAKLESLMDELELFYKREKTESGTKRYTVMFELEDETSNITCGITQAGTYGGQPVYSLWAWTTVVQSEEAVSDEAIKRIATMNDGLTLGNLSTSDDFTTVYSNSGGVIDEATQAGALFMYLGYAHSNRLDLKKELDSIVTK